MQPPVRSASVTSPAELCSRTELACTIPVSKRRPHSMLTRAAAMLGVSRTVTVAGPMEKARRAEASTPVETCVRRAADG
eukprot:5779739-Pleurochrysis_carterae.AAC.1